MKLSVVAGDAGGAAALAPCIKEASVRGFEITCYAYSVAGEIWMNHGIDAQRASEKICDLGDALLLGSSLNDEMLELKYIDEARKQNVPSYSFVDAWVNFGERFIDVNQELHWPDRMFVTDKHAQKLMVQAGMESSRIDVTGNPALDEINRYLELKSRAQYKKALRKIYQIPEENFLWLYVSQPLSIMPNSDIDENEVKDLFLGGLTKLGRETGRDGSVLVKPHPRESKGNIRKQWSGSQEGIQVLFAEDSENDVNEHALGADAVIGMNSMALVQAAILNIPVLSIQPGVKNGNDAIPSLSDLGGEVIRDAIELPHGLKNVMAKSAELNSEVPSNTPRIRQSAASLLLDYIFPSNSFIK
ncbi:MAG: hypothetical protein AAF649_02950 [Verrucomicrobiota bacterium]